MGLVQGLSEFLPISSSGHLVLFGDFLDIQDVGGSQVLLSVVAHLGTLIAVLIFFRQEVVAMFKQLPALPTYVAQGFKVKDDSDEQTAMILYIFIGTLPAAILGFTFKDSLEELFFNKKAVLVALGFNALVLWSSRYSREKNLKMTAWFALLIGCGQALAIIPGISRSGTTIVLALWLGVTRTTSASFSFLLSIPIIFGACVLEFREVETAMIGSQQLINMLSACIAAGLSGYIAIKALTVIVQKQKFEYFAYYCLIVSLCGFMNWI